MHMIRINKGVSLMNSEHQMLAPKELEAAFSLFTEASRQLSESYAELQLQAVSLTSQLEIANGALRKEFEEKAALSRRLTLLLERLPAGVLELNAEGVIIEANPAARRLLGRTVVGHSWQKIKDERFSATPETDLLCYREDGATHVRHLSLIESEIPEGAARLVLIHDLTESWELQQALARHQRLAAMGEMAAGLAHQLRTPLATALLYAGHFARPTLGDSDRIRFAGKMLDRLNHLEALIGNMLRFVRGQAQELEVLPVQVLLEEAGHSVLPQLEKDGLSLSFNGVEADALVCVNRKEMVGALINLLDNARLASCAGQQVTVRLEKADEAVIIRVVDEGCGMSHEVLSRLFDPFFTTRKDGTGLGLAIVRNMVALYGGDVSAESEMGRGSVLKIRLPLASTASNL